MEGVEVRVLNKRMVKPAVSSQQKTMYLPQEDVMCRKFPHNRRVLFYDHNKQGYDYEKLVEDLVSSLSVALSTFFPLAGRLVVHDLNAVVNTDKDKQDAAAGDLCEIEECRSAAPIGDGQVLHLHCNDAGVEFAEAVVVGASFSQLKENGFDHQAFFHHLVPWVHPHEYDSVPPFIVQVSRFECGSIALGIAHSHVVCDGTSLWHFMNSWAACARGENIPILPIHSRNLLRIENPQVEKAKLLLEFVEDDDNNHNQDVEKKMKIFHFSREMIDRLKDSCSRQASTYQTICAHIWKHVTKARCHKPNKRVSFMSIVNMRGRTTPPLGDGYFGNAVMWSNATTTSQELNDEDLKATANRLHLSIQSCTNTTINGWLQWLEVHGRDEIFSRCKLNGARIRASSSIKFPIFSVDFGWGKPLVARCPTAEDAGKIIFFPAIDGGIDVSLALPFTIMHRLENDISFTNP